MNKSEISVRGVQKTLLLPLWGRAIESQKEKPLLVDKTAIKIINDINYDFTAIANGVNQLSLAAWIARSIYFDNKIKEFLANNSNGTIINIGCGFDTTFDRVDNGKAFWYEIDFPEVIKLRKKYIKESKRRIFIDSSILDNKWHDKIANKEKVLIMMAGVVYYFEENEIKNLFKTFENQFNSCDIIFDYSTPFGVKIANKNVMTKSGMDKTAYLKWGIQNIYDIEKWNNSIKVIENMPMFKKHKKNYPFMKRIGMSISDMKKVMLLANIHIKRLA